MSKESIEEKADRYLSQGKVRVVSLTTDAQFAALIALAHVTGDSGGEPYHVRYDDESWSCDCPARIVECAHVVAATKVIQTIGEDLSGVLDSSELDDLLGL